MRGSLIVRGARQHNLKNISVELPHRAISVITGPSGSGKSSLAFDTIYAEGQRRYVESLSAYARQFLERLPKPDVDHIDGLAPAVAIEQRNPSRSARSTVGTVTEVYDYLRLLWARVGEPVCPVCHDVLRADDPGSAADRLLGAPEGARATVCFPLRRSAASTHALLIELLQGQGFVRVVADGTGWHLDDLTPAPVPTDAPDPPSGQPSAGTPPIDLTAVHELLVVADRLVLRADDRTRLSDALATAFRHGDGDAVVLFAEPTTLAGEAAPRERLAFTERVECPRDGTRLPEPTPQLFSFNNPRGACATCNGFGANLEYDLRLIVPDPRATLRGGAIHPWTMPRYEAKRRALAEAAKAKGIPLDAPWAELTEAQREFLLRGKAKGFVGILPFLVALEEKRYKQYIRVFLRQYQTAQECAACAGTRLSAEARQIRVTGRAISEVTALPIAALRPWLDGLALSPQRQAVAEHILREARARVRFLDEVGLGYLTLDRAARTLSGGEAQRIALANALGAALVDTLYVLDEPTIGLHPVDVDRLLAQVARLREGGNTVVMVEHDLAAMRLADHLVELGPASGEQGGRLVFSGPASQAAESPLTGQYLTGARRIAPPGRYRKAGPRWLRLTGARAHTLQGVDVRVPVGCLSVVTGVSGSGKSTLAHDVLFHALEHAVTGSHSAREHLGEVVGSWTALTGWEGFRDVVLVDQEPIGRSPRSNPVTYVKAFDRIRAIFADLPLSRQRGYTAGTFSFNVAGGRCEACEGAGHVQIEMQFMADVYVPCDACGGRRFKAEVLDVTYFGKSIVDVLELTVDQAIRFFPHEEKLGQALWEVQQVGLGYLRLGQPATTLSGGEAQRLKIARELALSAKAGGKKFYLLDEPTTGLHLRDVEQLLQVLHRLVDHGHTVLVIEHHPDVMRHADWLIDMGPGGGPEGGRVVVEGTLAELLAHPTSLTGAALRAET